jgi:FixJ family two-component response regulator
VREIAVRLLTAAGYEVLAAEAPEQAVAQARQHPPALLLTDVVMPNMSGRELALRMTAELPGLRVLFMSGYTDDVVTRHGIREGRLCFLEKPFTRQTLLEGVRKALDSVKGSEAA